ncbi:hypothetical protein FKO30_16775 [Acinetobacter baumannii]|nr:hypothetical protein [Acinetobacter baumannii]
MFKHSQILKKTLITTSLLTFSLSSHAALTFGNAEEGQLKVSGTVRAKANSNMRCDSFKSHMIINKLSKFL